jgi:hypothetical protein
MNNKVVEEGLLALSGLSKTELEEFGRGMMEKIAHKLTLIEEIKKEIALIEESRVIIHMILKRKDSPKSEDKAAGKQDKPKSTRGRKPGSKNKDKLSIS